MDRRIAATVMLLGVLATACSGSDDADSAESTVAPATTLDEVSDAEPSDGADAATATTVPDDEVDGDSTTDVTTTDVPSTTRVSTTTAPDDATSTTTEPSSTTAPATSVAVAASTTSPPRPSATTTLAPTTTVAAATATTVPPPAPDDGGFPNGDLLADPDAIPFQSLGDFDDWLIESDFRLGDVYGESGFVRGISAVLERDGVLWNLAVVEWESMDDATAVIAEVIAGGGQPFGDDAAFSTTFTGLPSAIGVGGVYTIVVDSIEVLDQVAVGTELREQLDLLP